MAFNIMGNFNNTNEQDLISDLVEEAIDQRGAPVHYILRDQLNPDYLLGESTMSTFKEFYELPMFIESIEHFNGNGDVFDAFGMQYIDSAIFQVGQRKFETVVSPFTDRVRPNEGDLVYLAFSDSLWEITKVKRDLKYYQVGRNHSYRLICKLFSFSHEEIESTSTTSDFNDLGTSSDLDDAGIKKLLGINSDFIDETEVLKQEVRPIQTVPGDTFGF